MPRQTIASLQEDLDRATETIDRLVVDRARQNARLVQMEATLRLMRTMIVDALDNPEARSDAAIGR